MTELWQTEALKLIQGYSNRALLEETLELGCANFMPDSIPMWIYQHHVKELNKRLSRNGWLKEGEK